METNIDGNLAKVEFSGDDVHYRIKLQQPKAKSDIVSLRLRYPVLFRKVFRRNIKILIAVSALFIILPFCFSNMDMSSLSKVYVAKKSVTLWTLGVFSYLAIVVSIVGYEALRFFTYDYLMDSKNVIIKKGVFAKHQILIPFSKINDVSIKQNLIDMFFGLFDVHISTPTQDSWLYSHICGLDQNSAVELTKLILEKANTSR